MSWCDLSEKDARFIVELLQEAGRSLRDVRERQISSLIGGDPRVQAVDHELVVVQEKIEAALFKLTRG